MVEQPEKFDSWAILELMGHRKLAGRVSEQIIAGVPLIRIDIPDVAKADGEPEQLGFTQFYGPQSIYSLTPTTEAIAWRFAAYRREHPVSPYELRALPAPFVLEEQVQEAEEDDQV